MITTRLTYTPRPAPGWTAAAIELGLIEWYAERDIEIAAIDSVEAVTA